MSCKLAPLVLLVLTLPAAFAAAPRIEARAAGGEGPRAVRQDDGSLSVVYGDREESLDLPARSAVAAIAAVGEGWWAAGTVRDGAGTELWLARTGEGSRGVAAPGDRNGAQRTNPVLLARASGLSGVAWLEGDAHDRFAVRFARWNGDAFAAPATIAPPGPGSQLALAGVVLADGKMLLVWAGYDGSDDEIWTAVGDGDGWSPPARVGGDNAVPDITPAIVATADGAFVVWSRFDGSEYRLALARWDGAAFGSARWLAEPGSLFPSFERPGGALGVLYRDARSDAWALGELDPEGRLRRTARVAAPNDERPAVALGRDNVIWMFGGRELSTDWE